MDTDARPALTPEEAAPSAWVAGSRVGFTALAQGVYFVATGIWPIVHLRSFEAVTGPKVDGWLVKTFGALVGSIGGALIVGAFEAPRSRALRTLGVGSAAVLALAEGVYVGKGRISKIYLMDALLQIATAGAWWLEERAHRNTRGDRVPRAAP
jgi:hypothetical protein